MKVARMMSGMLIIVSISFGAAFGQDPSPSASLRGKALAGGNLVIEGVMIVVVPEKQSRGAGDPVPARVDNTGHYRIESLAAGTYQLKAVHKQIATTKMTVQINPGNENVVNVPLELSKSRTEVSAYIFDKSGRPRPKTLVRIFSSELPASVCSECALAEVVSNENGVVHFEDLARDESYAFAVRSNEGGGQFVYSEPMKISPVGAQLALTINDHSAARLTAWDFEPALRYRASDASRTRLLGFERMASKRVSFAPESTALSPEAKQALNAFRDEAPKSDDYFVTISTDPSTAVGSIERQRISSIVSYLFAVQHIPFAHFVVTEPVSEGMKVNAASSSGAVFDVVFWARKRTTAP